MSGMKRAEVHKDFMIRALAQAEVISLRAAVYYLTGDAELERMTIQDAVGFVGVPQPVVLSDRDQHLVREKALALLEKISMGAFTPPPQTDDRIRRTMDMCFCKPVPDERFRLNCEELGLHGDLRGPAWTSGTRPAAADNFHVAVIGTGMGGLSAAIWLKKMGIPFTVFEKNAGVGGTWFENTFPDARVDVNSHWYHFSFEPITDPGHYFTTQPELRSYLEYCAHKYGVLPHTRFNTEVVGASFDEENAIWQVETKSSGGAVETFTANGLISAVGMLNRPKVPNFPGIDSFRGKAFHTSRWDHGVELAGKKVALIGTGASGMQLARPVAEMATQLTIFQRSPTWVLPVADYRAPISVEMKWLYRTLPSYVNWYRYMLFYLQSDSIFDYIEIDPKWRQPGSLNQYNEIARQLLTAHLKEQLNGRADLIEKCLPKYPPFLRRFVVDNDWYKTLTRDNVTLVSDSIQEITPRGVHTAEGVEHAADVLIYATGFHANRYLWPMRIEGRGGQTLDSFWAKDGPRAYLGCTVPGFPNLFCIYGPNTNPRSGHVCLSLELQARYALSSFIHLIETGARTVDCRLDVYEAFNTRLDQALSRTIWSSDRNTSYYQNEFGRVGVNSPWRLLDYWQWTAAIQPADYNIN